MQNISCQGVGSYIKLVFTKEPEACTTNPYGQITISFLKFHGNPIGNIGKSVFQPTALSNNGKEKIDQILIELGVPLSACEWDTSTNPELISTVDEETRETIKGIEASRHRAYISNDFETIQKIAVDLKELIKIGETILLLKRELALVVMKEDYSEASRLKAKILDYQKKRDNYDALYQTERYERMIVME